MYTNNDIKIGQQFKFNGSSYNFICEVIKINCDNLIGFTQFKIVNLIDNNVAKLYRLNEIFVEQRFIEHWNANTYTLILSTETSPIKIRSRLSYL